MMRPSIVALLLAAALPACAQRSGAHPGATLRSAPVVRGAPAFRSGMAPVTAMHGYARPLIGPTRAYSAQSLPHFAQPPLRYGTIAPPAAPAFYQRNHTYPTLRRRNRAIVSAYPTSVIGFLPNTGFFDDSWNDSSQPTALQQPDSTDNQYPAYPDYYAGYPPEYQPSPAYEQPVPTTVSASAPAPETVTLIFNNGQPSEQIQNYLATRTTLTVIDGTHRRDIPVADLDLAATVKANRDAGVDFQLPPGRQ